MEHLLVVLYFIAILSGVPPIIFCLQLKNVYKVAFLRYYLALFLCAFTLVLTDGVWAYLHVAMPSLPWLTFAHWLIAAPAETGIVFTVLMASFSATRSKIPLKSAVVVIIFSVVYMIVLILDRPHSSGTLTAILNAIFPLIFCSALIHVFLRRNSLPVRLRPLFSVFAIITALSCIITSLSAFLSAMIMSLALTVFFILWSFISCAACRKWSRSARALRTHVLKDYNEAVKRYDITRSQWHVIELLSESRTARDIAQTLGINTQSVWNTISALYRRTDSVSRIGLLRKLSQ
ncbi:MAG: hypothetical protein AABZ39_11715 [Spirochaetota bacterium]